MVTIGNAIAFATAITVVIAFAACWVTASVMSWHHGHVVDDLEVEIATLQNQLADHSLIVVELYNSMDDNYADHREFNYVVDAFEFIKKQHSIYDIRVTVKGDTHDDISLIIMNEADR